MLVNGLPITNVNNGDRSQVWGDIPLVNVARISGRLKGVFYPIPCTDILYEGESKRSWPK